jgi:hypothetical protein
MEFESKVEIGRSLIKIALLILGGVLLTAASAVIAFRILPGIGSGGFIHVVGWFGLFFFGLGSPIILWTAFKFGKAFVTVSPEGVFDARFPNTPIPWSAVTGVFEWKPIPSAQKIAMLRVTSDFQKSLEPTAVARTMGRFNSAIGASGVPIINSMLAISHTDLMRLLQSYWEQYGDKSEPLRVPRRPFHLSHAASFCSSSMV